MGSEFKIPLVCEDPPVRHGALEGRILRTPEEMIQAYQIRHRVIVEELHWLPERPENGSLEFDLYDTAATHFGVFEGDQIVGYIRAIPGNDLSDFLLGRDFSSLIDGAHGEINDHIHAHQHRSIEISRLVVAPDHRHSPEVPRLLYRLLTEWSWRRNYEHWYMVITQKIYQLFELQAFVLERLASGKVNEGGPKCIVARLYPKKIRENMREHLPDDHDWYFGDL